MKGICKHYNGTVGGQKACCDAWVNFRELVGGEDYGWLARLPCIASNRKRPDAVVCLKMELKTPEEEKADHDELIAAMDRVEKVDPLVAYLKKTYKGKNTEGTAKCPVCSGKVHWSIAGAYNGHVRMHCETEDCISFME